MQSPIGGCSGAAFALGLWTQPHHTLSLIRNHSPMFFLYTGHPVYSSFENHLSGGERTRLREPRKGGAGISIAAWPG